MDNASPNNSTDIEIMPKEAEDKTKAAHLVLARKYRPQKFQDLVGQDTLRKIMSNAFAANRLHHAFLLTGVRGTGKTSAARIIAKALNCENLQNEGEPCCKCSSCLSIAEGHNLDVIEIDAASQTSVDDIRKIISASHYKAVVGKCKVYIIDEVHMLSTSAFNALLKTLEEPPPGIVFILATTEVQKVPATVHSRCMRFRLKRVQTHDIANLLGDILKKEGWSYEEESLIPIARFATGSVRDALSMLEQAMAMSFDSAPDSAAAKMITLQGVKEMLGLSEVYQLYDVFESSLEGDPAKALVILKDIYSQGTSPDLILQELLRIAHGVSLVSQLSEKTMSLESFSDEINFFKKMNSKLSVPEIARSWQVLLKGCNEMKQAYDGYQVLDMLIIRLAYTSSLPTPAKIIRELQKEAPNAISSNFQTAIGNEKAPANNQFRNLDDLVAFVHSHDNISLEHNLKRNIRIIDFNAPNMKIVLDKGAEKDLAKKITKDLNRLTGMAWHIETVDDIDEEVQIPPTLYDQEKRRKESEMQSAANSDLVKKVEQLTGATFVKVTSKELKENIG